MIEKYPCKQMFACWVGVWYNNPAWKSISCRIRIEAMVIDKVWNRNRGKADG